MDEVILAMSGLKITGNSALITSKYVKCIAQKLIYSVTITINDILESVVERFLSLR